MPTAAVASVAGLPVENAEPTERQWHARHPPSVLYILPEIKYIEAIVRWRVIADTSRPCTEKFLHTRLR